MTRLYGTILALRGPADRGRKCSAKPVSGRYDSRASIVEQRADPVRAPSLRRDIDRCWPSTKPASGWPGPHVHTGFTERLPADPRTLGPADGAHGSSDVTESRASSLQGN